MIYHVIALAVGFVLDLLLGDPHGGFHPVRLIGKLIAALDKKWNFGTGDDAKKRGVLLVLSVSGASMGATAAILAAAYVVSPVVGVIVEAIMTYYILAARSLYDESMKVYKALTTGRLEDARRAVSMIVGRDTQALNDIGITKAAVETVAENTSDGVIAPLIFTAVGGPVLGMFYKAVNTMDSMVGYKNEKYIDFGWAAARLDDILNYIPSRVSAYLMVAACAFLGKGYDARAALKVLKRDGRKHASPNAAQTQSACAGALGIRLAGDASYFGRFVKKPFIGDNVRAVEYEDIRRANRLMLAAAALAFGALIIALVALTLFLSRTR